VLSLLIPTHVGTAWADKAQPATQPAATAGQTPAKSAPVVADICTDAVDPYNPAAQRALFFKAAGPDNEMDSKEFTADRGQASGRASGKAAPAEGFARRFDRWSALVAFDKNRNKTIDWFEADAYRRDIRSRVLAEYDKDKNGRLTGAERSAAVRALTAGRVPPGQKGRRLVGGGPIPRPANVPPPRRGPEPATSSETILPPDADLAKAAPARRDELLRRFDANGDGRLSDEERATMVKAIREQADEQKFLGKYDLNRDGAISAEERDAAMQKIREEHRAELMERYDADRDGQLSEAERGAIQAERGAEFREAAERWRLRDFDTDGNGELNAEEKAEADAFQKQLQDVGNSFRLKMADGNGDGKVSDEERTAVAREWRQAGLRLMIKAARYMDTDGDGQVSLEERTAFGQRAGKAMMKWAEGFQMKFDGNRDGRLSREERAALVAALKEELEARSAKFDADQDGRLNPAEAMEMLEAFAREIGIERPRGKPGSTGRPTIRPPQRVRKGS